MVTISPQELDEAAPGDALRYFLSRFSWLRPLKSRLKQALEAQEQMRPRPSFYYRWHLPRFLATFELTRAALTQAAGQRTLVIGSYAPFTYLTMLFLKNGGASAQDFSLTLTSLDGSPEVLTVAGERHELPTTALVLGDATFPWDDGHFDVVVITEIIEHVNAHPQFTLSEINRVSKLGGCLLLTTPNMTSWKKISRLLRGDWGFDSPTFWGSWGHRYEYSNFEMHSMLCDCGFAPITRATKDVYFDDPQGMRQRLQLVATLAAQCLTGDLRSAEKLRRWRGSTLTFL
jgi:SAM-dependent methyltransferase